jgi:hypothetical protein
VRKMQNRDRKGAESEHPSLTVGARKSTWDPEIKIGLFGLLRELRLPGLKENVRQDRAAAPLESLIPPIGITHIVAEESRM